MLLQIGEELNLEWYGGGRFGGPKGAVVGGLAVGVIASGLYAWARDEKPIEPDFNTKIYHLENEYNYIGEAHNELLSEILRNKDHYVKNGIVNYDLLFDEVLIKCKPYAKVNEIYYVQCAKRQIIDFNKEFVAKFAYYTNETNFVNNVFDYMAVKYPENKEDIQITRNYMLNATKITDINELKAYANGYEKIIVQSKINPEIKTDLLGTISVGKNSQAFWMSANN